MIGRRGRVRRPPLITIVVGHVCIKTTIRAGKSSHERTGGVDAPPSNVWLDTNTFYGYRIAFVLVPELRRRPLFSNGQIDVLERELGATPMERDAIRANVVTFGGEKPLEFLGEIATGSLCDPRVTDIK